VAAVTDSDLLSIMPHIADHFVDAKVKHFDYFDKDRALDWLSNPRAEISPSRQYFWEIR